MLALEPFARANKVNFQSGTGTPASMIWRVAPRSVLPGRIEKSTLGEASSIAESAYQNIQPQNPNAPDAASRNNSFSRNSIDSAKVRFDDARIINVKPDGQVGRRFNSASWNGRAAQLAAKHG